MRKQGRNAQELNKDNDNNFDSTFLLRARLLDM